MKIKEFLKKEIPEKRTVGKELLSIVTDSIVISIIIYIILAYCPNEILKLLEVVNNNPQEALTIALVMFPLIAIPIGIAKLGEITIKLDNKK